MCSKKVSLCFLFTVNLIVLLICLAGIGFVIWAHTQFDFDDYAGLGDFKADDVQILFYVVYGVLGGIAVICLIGLIACCCCQKCCMCIYAILLIILTIAMILFTICWIAVLSIVLVKLKDQLYEQLEDYESEYASNSASILINVLQLIFKGCGVEGYEDYKDSSLTPQWQVAQKDSNRQSALGNYNFAFPLTCCSSLDDIVDLLKEGNFQLSTLEDEVNKHQSELDQCGDNPPEDGLYTKIQKLVGIILGVGTAIFVVIIILQVLLLCAACNVIKNGPKKDKWSKKYEGEDGGDKKKGKKKSSK